MKEKLRRALERSGKGLYWQTAWETPVAERRAGKAAAEKRIVSFMVEHRERESNLQIFCWW
jgi:hypothetical protein